MANNLQYNAAVAAATLSAMNQNKYAAELRAEQQEARMAEEESEYDEDDELMDEFEDTFEDYERNQSKVTLLKNAMKIGFTLRQEVSDLRFDGLGFWFVLSLSAIKDLSDIPTLGLAGWITTFFVTPILFIFFFMRKSFFKRFFIKKFFGKYIIATIAEVIPGFSVFPAYTIAAILLKLTVDKEIRKRKSEIKELDKKINSFKNARA